jgi:hypothetical protein
MIEAQIQLQNALTTTFLANLVFLSKYDNELYHRIDELSRMIERGSYSEKYALDFIEENGEFDIYDIKNEKYLYNKKPKKINNDLINSKSEISFFNTFLFNREGDIDKEEIINNLEEGTDSVRLFRKDFQEYIDILKINPFGDKKEFNEVNKFLIIGTLSGRHIPKLAKKFDSSTYFICEANLEIFRLSLFVVDYTILTKNKGAIFSIMDDTKTFDKKINYFLQQNLFFNHKIKYSTTNLNVNNYFESIFSSIVRRDPMIFNHYMMQDCIMRNFANRISHYKILMFKEMENNLSSLKDFPVLYICAGPSLSDNIDWIKENKDKFIIVSIGASFEKLFDHGIESDIIVTLDSKKILADGQFKKESLHKIKNAIVIASTMTDDFVLNQFDKSKLFLYEVLYPFFDNKIFPAFSVGEMGLSILVTLNFDNIYMIGTDLALNQQTGNTHIVEHLTGGNNFDINDIDGSKSMNKNTFGFRGDLIKTRGNLQEEVVTSRVFESSIHCYNENIRNNKKESQKIYNLSTHGAFIEDTIPLFPEKLDLSNTLKIEDRGNIEDKLLFELNRFSRTDFSIKETDKINKEIEYINEVISYIESINDKKYKKYSDLYDDILIITYKLLNSEGNIGFGVEIFGRYFSSVLPYINYCLNDKKKVKGLEIKLDGISTVLYRQVLDLISRYNSYLVKMITIK